MSELQNSHNVAVKLLDKTYQIRCPSDKVQELQDAAEFLNSHMREIRDKGKVIGVG